MWFRIGTALFVLSALVVFAGVGVSLLWLLFANLERLLGVERSARIWTNLIGAVAVSGLGVLALFGVQIGIHVRTRRTATTREDEIASWMHRWVALDPEAPTPVVRGIPAAEALARLREEVTGPESKRFAERYQASGLLAVDVSTALRGRGLSRIRALERLAMIRHPSAIEPLLRLTQHRDVVVARIARRALARTLGRIVLPDTRLQATFAEAIDDPRVTEGEVAELLMLLQNHAEPVLAWMLDPDSDAPMRGAALDVVGSENKLDLADRLEPWLRSPQQELQAAALRAVAALEYAPPGTRDEILDALESPARFVRTQACKACIALPWLEVREPIVSALGDREWWVRRAAAQTLARFGAPGRAALATAAESHADPYARDMAEQVLAA